MKAESLKKDSRKSLWESTIQRPSFAPLKESTATDVLIIGGGLTGLLCAHMLKTVGIHCLLVEA
ncbi:MAG: FAD-dependent monooxygenase, partial [Firmicutes bacterium]|nr:FAD-dependent monooxygenase [Bacillota bacterium]